ncbi:MAG: murein biosynthesis integral membrane protein MurJ [Actinomycetota bacterium]|nr:murein biosynthesis integral membrane protein MurJ [Actinomycetota bacterium]
MPDSEGLPTNEPSEPAVSLARATAVMSAGTALSRITGFLRLSVMAWAIGGVESKLPDTYNLANQLPNIVYQLVLGEILATVFVPVFVEYITTRDREESWRLASTILNMAFGIAFAVSALTVLLAPWLIRIYTFRLHGADAQAQNDVGAFLLRLFMPQMIFYATGSVLTGLLNAHRKFAVPMFAPVLNNLIVMGTFVAFRALHPSGTPRLQSLTTADKLLLGGGTTAGVIVMTVVLWPYVRRLPGKYDWRAWAWRHPAVRHVGGLAKYSFGFVIVNQIGLFVVLALANGVDGGVTAFLSAYTLYQLPYGIFAVSVFTALIPSLSEHFVHGDADSFRRDFSLGLRMTSYIVLPAAAGFVALGKPIVRILLQHGVFSGESTNLFADTLVLMAIGLIGFSAFQQQTRAFYARQDTRTPWIVNFWATAFNVVANFPLYAWLGVPGLALAHALSYLTAAIYGGWVLRKQIGGIDGRRLLTSHARILAASVATGGVAWLTSRAVESHVDTARFAGQFVQVFGAIGAGLVVYVALSRLLRLEEFDPLWRILAGRFARSRA